MAELRARLRDALARAGAVPTTGRVLSHVPQSPAHPFAAVRLVEGTALEARPLGPAVPLDAPVGFVDGVQRYVVAGHVGITPVVRAVVAAAAVERVDGRLRAVAGRRAEFLVIPAGRLPPAARAALAAADVEIVDADAGERAHPLADLVAAGETVERRREALEQEVSRAFRAARPDAWLLVDGSLGALGQVAGPRAAGLIKSHETQFLDGADLTLALTLPCGARSTAFRRTRGPAVDSWYLRLWPWADRDLLHGLVRVELAAGPDVTAAADRVSRWLMAERAPIARDARWDRLLYPVLEIETLLAAQLGGWP